MATQITYTAAEKKKYKAWSWKGNNTSGSRAIKMRRPQCSECQSVESFQFGWWKTCEHDPYWSSQSKKVGTEVWETGPDGVEYLNEEKTIATRKTKRIRVPNIVEVPFIARSNDGRGPAKFHEQKGYLYMMEPDKSGTVFAPMCEMHGCGRSWPTVKTAKYGIYCSETHARACVADIQGSKTHEFAWVDTDLDEGVIAASKTTVTI